MENEVYTSGFNKEVDGIYYKGKRVRGYRLSLDDIYMSPEAYIDIQNWASNYFNDPDYLTNPTKKHMAKLMRESHDYVVLY